MLAWENLLWISFVSFRGKKEFEIPKLFVDWWNIIWFTKAVPQYETTWLAIEEIPLPRTDFLAINLEYLRCIFAIHNCKRKELNETVIKLAIEGLIYYDMAENA